MFLCVVCYGKCVKIDGVVVGIVFDCVVFCVCVKM